MWLFAIIVLLLGCRPLLRVLLWRPFFVSDKEARRREAEAEPSEPPFYCACRLSRLHISV